MCHHCLVPTDTLGSLASCRSASYGPVRRQTGISLAKHAHTVMGKRSRSVTKIHQRESAEDRPGFAAATTLTDGWLIWGEDSLHLKPLHSTLFCWGKALGSLPAFQVSGICLWLRSVVEVFSSVNSRIGVMLNTSLCGESSYFSPSHVWQLAHTDDAAVSVFMCPIDVGRGHHFGERTGWTVREWNVWFWTAQRVLGEHIYPLVSLTATMR